MYRRKPKKKTKSKTTDIPNLAQNVTGQFNTEPTEQHKTFQAYFVNLRDFSTNILLVYSVYWYPMSFFLDKII